MARKKTSTKSTSKKSSKNSHGSSSKTSKTGTKSASSAAGHYDSDHENQDFHNTNERDYEIPEIYYSTVLVILLKFKKLDLE